MRTDYRTVTSPEEVRKYIGSSTKVAFDFETAPNEEFRDEEGAALDPAKAHICTMSLSTAPYSGIMIPVAHHDGHNMDPEEFNLFLAEFVADKSITKICHNYVFESSFCYKRGIVIQEPVYDTMCAAQMTLKEPGVFRTLADSGLKTLAASLCKEPLPSFLNVTRGKNFDELDPKDPETIRYSCADADFAMRLYCIINDWFDRYLPKHRWIVEHIESPTAVYLGLMKYNGVPVDAEYMAQRKAEAEKEMGRIKREIAAIIGPEIDVGSNCSTKDFKACLFGKLGIPSVRKTDAEKDALDNAALQEMKEWCNANKPGMSHLFDLIFEFRTWSKIAGTYIDGYGRYINSATGHIHPNFFALETATGRFSCSRPNLQNMPRKTNDPIGVRNFVKAPEGHLVISCDYSQIELRVGSQYCRDETMIDTYRKHEDIHAKTTAAIYNISYEQALDKNDPDYKERRTIAKNCNFGVFFGLHPNGLRKTLKYKAGLDKTPEECEKIIAKLKAGYPGIPAWQEKVKAEAHLNGYVETAFGRRRYLPDIESDDWKKRTSAERCAINTPIQGTAADIIKLSMGRILAGLPERPWLRPILQIHDELTFIVPEDRQEEAIAYIKSCMEPQPYSDFAIPLVAEASAGRTFGMLEDIQHEKIKF